MHAVMYELDAKTFRWSFRDNVDCSILRTINFFTIILLNLTFLQRISNVFLLILRFTNAL